MSAPLILCYHAVSPSWPAPLSVTPAGLERQLGSLSRRGWRAARFADAVLAPPSPRTLAITFDDAFASVLTLAEPILSSLGMVATMFAPTAFMASGQPLAWPGIDHWSGSEHAGELQALSWGQLGELAEAGWEIGSHTRTHPRLTHLDDDALAGELADSRAELGRQLGGSCRSIAYPYGDVDARVVSAAGQAGYRAGAGLGRDLRVRGPLWSPRVGIYHRDAFCRFRLKTGRASRALRGAGRQARPE